MKLEWDEAKRQTTLQERGLDFAHLERFDWETAMVSKDLRAHALRVISMRKANARERKVYDRFITQTND